MGFHSYGPPIAYKSFPLRQAFGRPDPETFFLLHLIFSWRHSQYKHPMLRGLLRNTKAEGHQSGRNAISICKIKSAYNIAALMYSLGPAFKSEVVQSTNVGGGFIWKL